MLLLHRGGGAVVQLLLQLRLLAPHRADVVLKGPDLHLEGVGARRRSLELGCLQGELLLQAVDLPGGVAPCILGGNQLAVDDAVLALDVETALDARLDLEGLLLELRELLQEGLVLRRELLVLRGDRLVVGVLPCLLLLEVHHLLLELVPLELDADVGLDLSAVRLLKVARMALKRAELQQLSLEVELFPLGLRQFPLLLGQLIRQ